MNNTEANIHNLTSLWRLAGSAFQTFEERKGHYVSKVEQSEWPNRVWWPSLDTPGAMEDILVSMEADPGLSFSCFKSDLEKSTSLPLDKLSLKSMQYGMSLPLTKAFEEGADVDLIRVRDKAAAESWSATFKEAFRYLISTESIMAIGEQVQFFLVLAKGNIVGTVLLFMTGNTAGIHSLGILPSARGNAYATAVMRKVLNKAIDQGAERVSLQASRMAKDMYLKMGFEIDFYMENYRLKQ